MSQEPQELAANEWSRVIYHPQWDTLELRWDQSTRSMADEGFKQTLQILADQGLKVRPFYVMVAATEFFYTLGEGVLAWRDENIVPLYNEAGFKKFAFLAPEAMSGTVEKGGEPAPDGPATFPTGFETRERMYAWLTG